MKSYLLVFLFVCFTAIAWIPNGVMGANRIAKLHSLETTVEYEVDVKKFDRIGHPYCLQTPAFELNDVTWKVQACKNTDIDVLDMSLVAILKGDSEAWSCDAKATFKLLPIDGQNYGQEAIVQSFETYNFNKDDLVRTINDFVTWDDFYEKYVKDDRAIFEITIAAKTPNRAARLDESSAKFEVRLKNVGQLGYEYSYEIIVCGIRWKVLAMKSGEYLVVSLIANGDDMGIDVSWKVNANFHLISTGTDNIVSKSFSDVSFDWTNLSFGFPKFITWTELLDANKKFVLNDKAIIKVELSVSEPIKTM